MLDARRLAVLATVVDEGTVTAAGELLQLTPSAVSQQLAALERQVGTPLFERAGRRLRPTPAGRLLADHGRVLVAQLEDAERDLAALRAGRSGRMRVVTFPSAGESLVPHAVAQFRRRLPDIEVGVTVMEPPESVDLLVHGRAEIVLAQDSYLADGVRADPALHHVPLLSDPYRAVLPVGHPLAGRRAVALADLADEDWVQTATAPQSADVDIENACRRAGFRPRYVMAADDYPATQGYVAAGLGVALVPELALGAVRAGVVARPLAGAAPVREIAAVTRTALLGDVPVPAMLKALRVAARRRPTVARQEGRA